MTAYAPPAYRPAAPARPWMGSIRSLDIVDWLMLVGGGIVTGAGINTVVGGVAGVDFVGIILGGVITLVGGTVFVSEMRKLLS